MLYRWLPADSETRELADRLERMYCRGASFDEMRSVAVSGLVEIEEARGRRRKEFIESLRGAYEAGEWGSDPGNITES